MDTRISVEELSKRLNNLDVDESELRKYFTVDEEHSGLFLPCLVINEQEVAIDMATPEGRSRSALLLNSLNDMSRFRRHLRFNRKVADSSYEGPIILSEGDSWFQYPLMLKDVIDWLSDDYAVRSLGAAGDTLDNMLDKDEYFTELQRLIANHLHPSIVLLSAGGNDVLGGGDLKKHLREFDPVLTPAEHLESSYNDLLAKVEGQYDIVLRKLETISGLHIICHGYDYCIPNSGRWLGKPMEKRNITDPAFQRAIVKEMVDRFHACMRRLTKNFDNVSFLDNRGVVTDQRWHDELHPVDEGYHAVALRFKEEIEQFAGPRSRQAPAVQPVTSKSSRTGVSTVSSSRMPTTGKRKGMSLHIGLNSVDPSHYAGWDGQLIACENDAYDMHDIAQSMGFVDREMLLTGQATRQALLTACARAANELQAGDIFLLTYSGHGGQLPDLNFDESDNLDETWCLYDGQILDDELFAMYARFREGVRILVLSDSCHSGSVIRAAGGFLERISGPQDPNDPTTWPRCMSDQVASRVFRQNRAFYTELSKSARGIDYDIVEKKLTMPLACTVRLLSGCQDNQTSMDGPFNGAFTGKLLRVWAEGRFQGNYAKFHQAIVKGMPRSQTPNMLVLGAPNPPFDTQKPFSI
ncbi:caspase family protein [Desulfovibrio inopinatus]|uniref:caspase family protein n=1 Tax=Desulfovibrio inopinatus TaxID=102109 RepID=UPI00040CC960|nr:caspase family protein [Desulfovibrio inopinatus]